MSARALPALALTTVTLSLLLIQTTSFIPYSRPSIFDIPFDDPFRILEQSPLSIPYKNTNPDQNHPQQSPLALARADWKETKTTHVITLDVPGMKKEDIKIEVEENRVLRVSGEREAEKKGGNNDDDKWHRVERTASKFWRSFRLPNNVDLEKIHAKLEDGVLKIVVPKLVLLGYRKMSSAFPGGGPDLYGGGGGRSMSSSVGNNNLLLPNNATSNQHHRQALLRLQQRQQVLLQQRPSIGGIVNDPATNQIGNRRPDFLGKRSFADLQNFSQVPLLQPSNQPLNHHQFSVAQQQQQTPFSLLQHQLHLRSVKQRTNPISPHSIINNTNTTNNINTTLVTSAYQNHVPSPISSLHQELSSPSFSESATTRYGVPVYQHPHPTSLINNSNCSNHNGLFSASFINNNTRSNAGGGFISQNLGGTGCNNSGFINRNLGGTGAGIIGYDSNFGTNRVLSDEQKPESRGNMNNINDNNNNNNNNNIKIMDTLQELEKQLLDDNDEVEGDAVSVITNSEWSETFQNLMSPSQAVAAAAAAPTTPSQAQNPNNLTSLSPSSSTSSCSSTATTVPEKQLISDAATAISEGKTESAVEILSRLSQLGNPTGNSEQRLVYYMCNALRYRACPNEHQPPVRELLGKEHMDSMYLLHDLSLCYKFGLFAANSVMMEAIGSAKQEESIAHVIDFDIGHGGQYKSLLRALGERQSRSGGGWNDAELKITVVTTELANNGELETVKDGLLKTAELAGVKLRFNAVNRRIRELTPESLGIEEGESLVVNFAFMLYRVPDESVSMDNLRDELLRRVKGLRPRFVTLVEQEMNGNTTPFMTRVNECVAYYGALLDLLESGPTRDKPDRLRVEEGLGRKMMNSVGCEGRDRVERCEVYGKWRARMGMAGFEMKPLPHSMAESMKINSSRVGDPKFTVKEENGGVCFGWMGRALTVASAWR